jgi:hypothetical protein
MRTISICLALLAVGCATPTTTVNTTADLMESIRFRERDLATQRAWDGAVLLTAGVGLGLAAGSQVVAGPGLEDGKLVALAVGVGVAVPALLMSSVAFDAFGLEGRRLQLLNEIAMARQRIPDGPVRGKRGR